MPDDLQRYTSYPGRIAPAAPIKDRRDRYKPPDLTGIFTTPGKAAQIFRPPTLLDPNRRRHRKPPQFAMLHAHALKNTRSESGSTGFGI